MKKFFLAAIVAAACVATAGAELRTGTLGNGLTYYIRTNSQPAGTADFFLAQKAGSVNETDDQRGLAHFLEHMCFNGTEHFPDNTLISWLESVGVKFGTNLNACTSTDETVYNISKVPVQRISVVDSCFLILRDWSCGLTLDPQAIDAERDVIVNEWRSRNSATNRMLEKALPALYPGSIYANRMPIGSMDVIRNFSSETLYEFYQKWYNPSNQAVIVVGDINPDYAEAKIRELFAPIPAHGEKISSLPEVVENRSLIVETQSDPEQGVNLIQLHFRHPEYADETAADLAGTMLAARFDDIELDPECPHTYLGIGETKYMLSRGVHSLVMRGVAKPGRGADALSLWYTELSRALRHGFTQPELDRAKKQMLGDLDKERHQVARYTNTRYARMYARDFIDGKPSEEPLERIDADVAAIDTATLEDVSTYLRSVVDTTGRNAVVLSYCPEREDFPAVDAGELRRAFHAVNDLAPKPYIPKVLDDAVPLAEPVPGRILSEKPYWFDGVTEYVLSNGIRVLAWQSTDTPSQIFIRGIGTGGLSQNYNEANAPSLKLFNETLAVCGTADHSANDLHRICTGCKIAASISVSNTEEIVEAATCPEDMTDAFRMIHLRATSLQPDSLAFMAMIGAERNKLRHQHSNPIQVMGDSIHRNVYSRHPLGAKTTLETLDGVDLGEVMEVYRDRFSDMADFVFYVAGDFDVDSLRNCIERYVASLPAAGRIEKPRDIGYRFTRANRTVDFSIPMKNDVAVVYNFFTGEGDYDLPDVIAAAAFGQIMRTRLLAEIREKRGMTYSVQGHTSISAGMNGDDGPQVMMPCYIKADPGNVETVDSIVNATVEDMLTNGITPAELASAKEFLAKNYAENITDNGYRLAVMKARERFGKDMHTRFLEVLQGLDDVRPYVQGLRRWHTRLIMLPLKTE